MRGIGQLAHFISQALSRSHNSSALSLKEREGWDGELTSFRSPPFGLRPEAVILDRAVFASLSRGQSNPLRGFSSTIISLETKSEALRLRFSFQRRERDSNPRSCDRLRISRPAHSTTLASLRGFAAATFFFITSSPALLKTFDFKPLFSTFGAKLRGPNRLQVYKCECTSGLIECSIRAK